MAKICRTCTQVITYPEYFCLDGSYISTNLQVQEMLQSFIPELDVDLIPNSVMCKNCMSALHIAYYFKQEAIKNEQLFHSKQRIRIKNFDDLTRNALGEIETPNDHNYEDKKVSAFEVELEDASDLKVEFVYEDADEGNDVEVSTEIMQAENIDGKGIECQSVPCNDSENVQMSKCASMVPYDERLQLLESLPCDVNLQVSDETLQTDSFEMPSDNDEVEIQTYLSDDVRSTTPDTESDERKVSAKNITSYIQRTPCSSRKIRDVKRPYKCSECDFCSDAKASLTMHKRIHTGEKPFHCTLCSYKAKRKAHLDDHMKIHTGERPYRCPMCDKSFITKQIMKKHARIHTGETPYQCVQCNFRSRHKLSIANHIKRVHIGLSKMTDTQRTVCYICGKCLSGPASLSTHMRIHTGIKSHLCELCGRYFREKGMLKNHLRTHTGEKPFKCTECDYIATRKAHLQDHMRTHVGLTELAQCTDCGKRYATKLLLKKHMKEEHKMEFSQMNPFT